MAREECPVCGRTTRPWAEKNGFAIRKCTSCGHGFALPRPSRVLTNAAYMALSLDEALEGAGYRRRQRAGASEPAAVARRFAALSVSRGRVLDVGAGEGRFTRQFQDIGFEVTPLEIHPLLAARIESETGLSVVRIPFEAWRPDAPARFDAVVMSQSLEHVVEPALWLAHARSLLVPEGVLFVSVPNFASALVALLRSREGNLCPPTHLNFFTPRSLERLAQDNGFAALLVETPSVLPLEPAVHAARQYLHLPATALAILPGIAAWALMRAAEPFGAGRFVYGFFRKSPSRPRLTRRRAAL